MRKFIISLCVLSVVALAPATALCETPASVTTDAVLDRKIALTRRFFKAMEMDKMVGSMMQSMIPMMIEQQRKASPSVTAEQGKAISDSVIETMAAVTPAYIEKTIDVYADAFTEEELTGMVAFYESPIGQSIVHKTPGLMPKTTQIMMDMIPELQADMKTRLCKKIDCAALEKAQSSK